MPADSTIEADDLAEDWETVRQAKALARQWAELADTVMARIKERLGEAEELTIGGRPAVRHSTRTVTRLDTKRLRADLPEPVLAPYLNVTTEHRYELITEES